MLSQDYIIVKGEKMQSRNLIKLKIVTCLIFTIFILIFFSPGRTATAVFKVYVPEEFGTTYTYAINGSIKPYPDQGSHEYWFVNTSGDTFLYVGPSFPGIYGYKQLIDYRGEFVTFKSSYFTLDDENWYAESIHSIKINTEQDLGYYPNGIHGTNHDLEPRWWYWWS